MSDTLVLYGDSGLGKTTSASFFARYIYEKTGKKLRLISADGGGWRPLQSYINAGIVEPLSIVDIQRPNATPGLQIPYEVYVLRKLSKGWWPEHVTKDGQWLEGKLIETPKPKLLSDYGGYIFEGLTSISDLLLAKLRGIKLSMAGAISMKIEDEAVGSNAQDHYGFIQNEMVDFLIRVKGLPFPSEYPTILITSHEATAEDDDTRLPIRGPGLAGKKGTPRVPKAVGEMFHLESFSKPVLGVDGKPLMDTLTKQQVTRMGVRAYFQNHPDPLFPTITYKCKSRMESTQMERLLEKYPGGYFECKVGADGGGLDIFLSVEDELLERGTDEVRRWMEALRAGEGEVKNG